MPTKPITDENFDTEVIKAEKPVIVDFWAEWCGWSHSHLSEWDHPYKIFGPCKQIGPILEEIAIEYESKIKVLKINIDENLQTPQKFGVRGIPTLMFFKEGKLVESKVGSLSKTTLEVWIKANL